MQAERLALRMELKHWPWQLPVGLRLSPSSSGPLGYPSSAPSFVLAFLDRYLGCLIPEGLPCQAGICPFLSPCEVLPPAGPECSKLEEAYKSSQAGAECQIFC